MAKKRVTTGQKDELKPGMLVWAKMKGSPPWPGMVTNPTHIKKPKSTNKAIHCIYFFGSSDYGWIEDRNILPHTQKVPVQKKYKNATFKKACQVIALYQKLLEQGEPIIHADGTCPLELPAALIIDDPTPDSSPKTTVDSSKIEKAANLKRMRDTEDKKVKPLDDHDHKGQLVKKPKQSSEINGAQLREPKIEPKIEIVTTSKIKAPEPGDKRIGFVGLGDLANVIIKRLLSSGHEISVWHPITAECQQLVNAGALLEETLLDVVSRCFITFLSASNPDDAKELVFGVNGLLCGVNASKSLVNMTTMDPESSTDISESILETKGRYLETQFHGGNTDASEGKLMILASGDKSLFQELQPIFRVVGKKSFYLDEIGGASKMNLCLQSIIGVGLASLAETMALGYKVGLNRKCMVEILESSSYSSQLLVNKARAMADEETEIVDHPLHSLEKDFSLVMNMAGKAGQPMPVATAANGLFSYGLRLGNGAKDSAVLYKNFQS